MSVALFPSGEPLRVSISASWVDSRNGALIGFMVDEASELRGIIVTESGQVVDVSVAEFSIDWRYDVENDVWVDVNAQRAPETDQEG